MTATRMELKGGASQAREATPASPGAVGGASTQRRALRGLGYDEAVQRLAPGGGGGGGVQRQVLQHKAKEQPDTARLAAMVQAACPSPNVAKARGTLRGLMDRYLAAHPELAPQFQRFIQTFLAQLAPKGLSPGDQYRVLNRLIAATTEFTTTFAVQSTGPNCALTVEKALIEIYRPELLLQYATNDLVGASKAARADLVPDLVDDTLGQLSGSKDHKQGLNAQEFRTLTHHVMGWKVLATQTLPETNTKLDTATNFFFKYGLGGMESTIKKWVKPGQLMTLSLMSSPSSALGHKLLFADFGKGVQVYDPGHGSVSGLGAIRAKPFTEYGKVITWEVYQVPR